MTQKIKYLSCLLAAVVLVAIFFDRCTDNKISYETKLSISVGDVIDTSHYDLNDHVETVNVDSLLSVYDIMDSMDIPKWFGDLSTEQLGYVTDALIDRMDIDSFLKTRIYFIHCTASKEGVDLDGDWFLKFFEEKRGWSRPGYSGVILLNGKMDTLREFNLDGYTSIDEFTYGVRGVNMESLHFAYVGGVDENLKPKDTRTEAQKIAIARLIEQILCSDPNAVIIGHRDHPNVKKACPSFDVREYYRLN